MLFPKSTVKFHPASNSIWASSVIVCTSLRLGTIISYFKPFAASLSSGLIPPNIPSASGNCSANSSGVSTSGAYTTIPVPFNFKLLWFFFKTNVPSTVISWLVVTASFTVTVVPLGIVNSFSVVSIVSTVSSLVLPSLNAADNVVAVSTPPHNRHVLFAVLPSVDVHSLNVQGSTPDSPHSVHFHVCDFAILSYTPCVYVHLCSWTSWSH